MTSIRRVLAASLLTFAACAVPAQTPEPRVRLELAGAQVLGNTQAPLTMVEFSDYECTFCQQYYATAFAELKRDFIDTGKLRYVVRDFPLPSHRNAARAARAAHCAADQGRFWEMHAALLKGESLDLQAIVEAAQTLGLDGPRLRACVESGQFDGAIRKSIAEANAAGVNSTPTFVIGPSRGGGVEGTRFAGSLPYADYAARIKALLPAAPR
jgi:protein-disulfide isomerase